MTEFSAPEHDQNDLRNYAKANFTAREIQCLTEIISNKSMQKVSEVLTTHPRTIYFYLVNIQHKINSLIKSFIQPNK